MWVFSYARLHSAQGEEARSISRGEDSDGLVPSVSFRSSLSSLSSTTTSRSHNFSDTEELLPASSMPSRASSQSRNSFYVSLKAMQPKIPRLMENATQALSSQRGAPPLDVHEEGAQISWHNIDRWCPRWVFFTGIYHDLREFCHDFRCGTRIKMPGVEPIPRWAVCKEVLDLLGKWEKAKKGSAPIPIRCCCGPAIVSGVKGVIVLVVAVIAFFFLGFAHTTCTENSYPGTLMWIACLPFGLARLGIEFRCLRYALLPYLQVVKRFTIWKQQVSFNCWLVFMATLSIVNMLDFVTDVLFFATTYRLQMCDWDRVEHAWKMLGRTSLPGEFLGSMYYNNLSLRGTTMLFYVLSLVQVFYSLLEACPRPRGFEKVEYIVGLDDDRPDDPHCFEYESCASWLFTRLPGQMEGEKTNHFEALISISDASGMASISQMTDGYPYHSAQNKIGSEKNLAKMVPLSVLRNQLPHLLSSCSKKAFLTMFLESALQINLQITVLGLKRALNITQNEMQALFSIIISLLVAVFQISKAIYKPWVQSTELMKQAEVTQKSFDDYFPAEEARQSAEQKEKRETDDQTKAIFQDTNSPLHPYDYYRREYTRHYKFLQWRRCWIPLFGLLTLVPIIYGVVKLVFVLFICEDAMWNITGCVDMSLS